ncbi:MAG: hypothetical protein KAI66_22420 [Lentisphaeria bacterium]|nr:hypothetical protein [Lentisphaeria bacterium]
MVFEAISHVADCLWQEPFSPLIPAVARALGSLSAHLIRPEDVEEKKKDEPEDEWRREPSEKPEAWLLLPLHRLESLGSRTLTVEGVDAVAAEVENIFVRDLWCRSSEVVSDAAKVIATMHKKHRDGEEDRPRFLEGSERMRLSGKGMLELLHGERSKDWRYAGRVLKAVL